MADAFAKMDMEIKIDLNPDWATVGPKLQDVVEIAARHVELDAKDRLRNWPAIDQAFTFNSTQSRRQDREGLTWRIGPTTDYAPFIEFGTWKMRARPFLVPSAEREKPRFEKAVRELFKDL